MYKLAAVGVFFSRVMPGCCGGLWLLTSTTGQQPVPATARAATAAPLRLLPNLADNAAAGVPGHGRARGLAPTATEMDDLRSRTTRVGTIPSHSDSAIGSTHHSGPVTFRERRRKFGAYAEGSFGINCIAARNHSGPQRADIRCRAPFLAAFRRRSGETAVA